ncbi:MAG TPA: tyrosine-type recombinase/integrase [Blastocatellia bacterium]|nr:tyrosine-type recombinase/integrase [Blastocatellia bacterium]
MEEENALLGQKEGLWREALRSIVALWADSSTVLKSPRRDDLRRDKRRAVEAFFAFAGKRPAEVEPQDVLAWQSHLRQQKLSANSIYTRVSFLSSFFGWAIKNAPPGQAVAANPVQYARPKRPKPYQTEATKALDDEQVRALVRVVTAKAEGGNIIAKRDLALLLWYLLTGMRRAEVIGLRGKDIELKEDSLVVTGRVKGGTYVGREVADPDLRAALIDYLTASHRLHALRSDAPLWTRHDLAGKPGEALTSHSFVRNLKRYAEAAGLRHIHLHQTRHTYARIVSEETGSIIETQDALGHESPKTTRVYVQRIAIKRDKHSKRISARFRE